MNDTTMPPPSKEGIQERTMDGSSSITSRPIHHDSRMTRKGRQQPKKGFGLHDWNLLVRSAKDLAQLKGQPLRQIRKEEVRQHKEAHDGWIILQDKVYNIVPYIPYHPGGESIVEQVLGKDATQLFQKYHPWVNIDGLIGTLLIGYLDKSPQPDDQDEDEERKKKGSSLY